MDVRLGVGAYHGCGGGRWKAEVVMVFALVDEVIHTRNVGVCFGGCKSSDVYSMLEG